MTERLVENEQDRKLLQRYIERQPLPFTAKISPGRQRSVDQNRLQWMWANESAEQRPGMTAQDVQAEWKLFFGIPILAADDKRFATAWALVDQLPYHQKINLMRMMPVTSAMTMRQAAQFLDEVYRFHTDAGIKLTTPEDLRWVLNEGKAGRRGVGGRDTGHADTADGAKAHR